MSVIKHYIDKDETLNTICKYRCGFHQIFKQCKNQCELCLVVNKIAPKYGSITIQEEKDENG